MATRRVVIIGGGAIGSAIAYWLTADPAFAGEVVVLERDQYVSFANCGLPYHIGGAIPERASPTTRYGPSGMGGLTGLGSTPGRA